MDVLDERGRLFGIVNVIDALVLLAAVVLVIGGVFVVFSDADSTPTPQPDSPPPERYATVSFDVPLDSPATTVSSGDRIDTGGGKVNVTDIQRSTTVNGLAHVTAVFKYRGTFVVKGAVVLAGDEVTLATREARVNATVRSIEDGSATLETSERAVVIAVDQNSPGASILEPGDAVTVTGDQVATVEAVSDQGETRTHVELTITARETAAGPSFGGQLVRVGQRIGVVTDDAIVQGQVVAMETSDPGDVE